MSDVEALAMSFATTVATGAGKAVIDWLKLRLSSSTAEAADTLAADPDNSSAKKILADNLKMALEECPSLIDELRTLLDQAGASYAPQQSTASGRSAIVQIQGNNNRT